MSVVRDARTWLLAGIVVLVGLGGSLAEMQRDDREWARAFDASQSEITWAVASLMLEHYRLGAALRRFGESDGAVEADAARDALLERFEIYYSRYDALGSDAERRLASIDWAGAISTSSRPRVERLEASFGTLHREAVASLEAIERDLLSLDPDDAARIDAIGRRLDALGDGVGTYLLDTFERIRYVNRARRQMTDRLSDRLRAVSVAFLGAGLLSLLVLLFHLHHRARSVRTLARSNERLAAEIEETTRLARELERRATHDSLSTLLNRRGFSGELGALLADGLGEHGLCFIDLDRFKIVNDTCGHEAGDRLIVELGALIASHARPGDLVSRHGGDEFLLLVRDCPEGEFQDRVRALCQAMRGFRFTDGSRRFDVSGSFGAVHFAAGGAQAETLLATADAACYVAKRAGGGRVHFHGDEDGLLEARRDELDCLSRIRAALDENRFALYRQPIRSLETGAEPTAHRWELLLRMIDTDGRVLPPSRFLDVAERYSMSTAIDRWVVDEAFSRLGAEPDFLDGAECVNINLSGRSIGDAQFLAFLEERTATLAVPPSRVCFEVTESAAIGPDARTFLSRLGALGYRLALDDFGAGFSSFGYLESLPVDCIKIDGQFVRDIDTDPVHREFVRAISAVGHAMGKSVVAEFVGSEAALERLRELGVDFAQGYHVGEPEPLPSRRPAVHVLGTAAADRAA